MSKKNILHVGGAIIVGVLGSAVWDVLKPMLGWMWDAAVMASTLGMQSVKDKMYADAAQSVLRTSSFTAAAYYGYAVMTVFFVMALQTYVFHGLPSIKRVRFVLLILVCWVSGANFLLQATRKTYVDQLASHYLYVESHAAPYMSEKLLKFQRAAFVSGNNRESYIKSIQRLNDVLIENGRKPIERDYL